MIRKITDAFGNDQGDTDADEEDAGEGPFNISQQGEVLETEHTRSTLKSDVQQRENDLKNLKAQIRERWQTYQYYLEQARDKTGIDELEAKTRAKEAKKSARDGEKLFKLLWKELHSMRNALRKDEQVKVISGDHYDVNLSSIDTADVERMAEEHRQMLRSREMKVDEFQDGVDRMEEDEIQIDFSDIEKDVADLEMQDVEIMVEDQDGVKEAPQQGNEWS